MNWTNVKFLFLTCTIVTWNGTSEWNIWYTGPLCIIIFTTPCWASQVVLVVKNPPADAGDLRDSSWSLDQKDPLEEGMATHSSILIWRLQSMGLQRVRHDWSDLAYKHFLKIYNFSKIESFRIFKSLSIVY